MSKATCCVVAALLFAVNLLQAVNGANLTLPFSLRAGDTVGFISPASRGANPDQLRANIIQSMNSLGLKAKFGKYALGDGYGYFAATDQHRADDIMAMFQDTSVKAIVAVRGGWGCDRLLDMLDYDIIAQNPKILMGFSDLTALINAVTFKTGLTAFHGPMGVNNWQNYNSVYTKQVLMQGKQALFSVQDGFNITTFRGGKARGRLIGGNLSVFASMVGSKYLPNPESLANAVVFLEEVEEYPYRVDRMLTTLHLGGWFDHAAAVVFGRCTSCNDPNPPGKGFSIMEVLSQRFSPLPIPSFYGAMFGHISEMYVLPVGGMVEVDADKGTIQMLEPAVTLY